jgi:hypothetical protein
MTANPILLIDSWGGPGPQQRGDATARGLDKIFDPGLRCDISPLVEDVWANGDAALTDRAS